MGRGGGSKPSECGVSLERKLLYLHEAYLGSRLQNNGRKRAHGTFPFQRACVPLSRVSWPPRRPAVNREGRVARLHINNN